MSSLASSFAAPYPRQGRTLCAHCGLPARAPHSGTAFCCGGCALAYRITGGEGGAGEGTGLLMAVGVGAFLAMNVMMLSFVLYSGRGELDRPQGEAWVRWALLALASPALVLLGGPLLTRGLRGVRSGSLDTDSLIVLGVLAAYVVSLRSVLQGAGPIYLDTAMGILLFVTIGRYLEAAARARTTDALLGLLRQMPDRARRLGAQGEEEVALGALRPGDQIRVLPGERLPADGRVVEGRADISEAEVTGEWLPAPRGPGDLVVAGTLNLDGSLVVEVERTGADTTLARLVRLVEDARASGYPFGPIVDEISRAFVPLVLLVALGTFLYWAHAAGPGSGILNALCVLLIACPCAIGIATPIAAAAAAGRAAAEGVLVRRTESFERLARAKRAFLDKTGTLTRGELCLQSIVTAPALREEMLLRLASSVERHSEHPLARAIVAEAKRRGISPLPCSGFRAFPGRGVEGTIDGCGGPVTVRIGREDFSGGIPAAGTAVRAAVHLSLDGVWQGSFVFEDTLRREAPEAVRALEALGVRLEVLSGDRLEAGLALLPAFASVSYRGELKPEEKLARVEESVEAREHPIMLGDGINDGPALSKAAVGVTLESGTDLAREVADVTILGGDLRKLPWLIGLSRATLRVAKANLLWAFGYNLVGVALAALGLLHPLFGALAMIVSSLLVTLHSQGLSRYPSTVAAK